MSDDATPKWDAFLSYSGDDDLSPPQWVTALNQALKNRLRVAATRLKIKVWFAPDELPGHSRVHDPIKAVLNDCHVFICVASSSYVQNAEARLELDHFLARGHVGEPKILKIIKLPLDVLDEEELPDLLVAARGYDFHSGNRELEAPGWHHAVATIIDELRDLVVQARKGPKARVLLLASPDRAADREEGLLELRRKGYEVMPRGELPRPEELRKQALRDYLKVTDSTVLLFGRELSPDMQFVYQLLTDPGASEQLKDALPPRCLLHLPVPEPSEGPALDFYKQALGTNSKAFDRFRHPDWVEAAKDLLDAVTKASRKPTIHLRYSPEEQQTAAAVTRLIPESFSVLDSSSVSAAEAETMATQSAHGILLFTSVKETFARIMNQLRRATRSYVAVHAGPFVDVPPPPDAFIHPLVFPDFYPPNSPLSSLRQQARQPLTLQQFLERVRSNAEGAG